MEYWPSDRNSIASLLKHERIKSQERESLSNPKSLRIRREKRQALQHDIQKAIAEAEALISHKCSIRDAAIEAESKILAEESRRDQMFRNSLLRISKRSQKYEAFYVQQFRHS